MKTVSFKEDLDELWDAHDINKDGHLNKAEAKKFIDKLVQGLDYERAKNYNPENFEKVFEEFDEDKNDWLTKGEMATLIKKVFRNSQQWKAGLRLKNDEIADTEMKSQF